MLNRSSCSRFVFSSLPLLAGILLTGCETMPRIGDVADGLLPGRQRAAGPNDAGVPFNQSLAGDLVKGRSFEKAGQWDQAREVYKPLIVKYPDRYEPFHRLGVVADQQRRHREAQAMFTRALQLNPRDAQLHNDLGYCFYLQGKLDKAESSLLKATRLDPFESRYWNNLGMVMGHQERPAESLEAFRQAGSEADAQFNLAFVFASQDKADEAKKCFELALAADPSHEKARRALRSFEAYEKMPEGGFGPDVSLADDGNYIPYVESTASGGVQQASHVQAGGAAVAGDAPAPVAQPRNARKFTRALHNKARAVRENPSTVEQTGWQGR